MAIFRTWMRVVAALVASIYVIGHLGAFLHTTLERHVVCAEHGHLLHADEATDADHVEQSEEADQWRAMASHHGEHEHCSAWSVLKPMAKRTAGVWLVGEAPFRVDTVLEASVASTPIRGPTVAIFLLAPKTSPPTA